MRMFKAKKRKEKKRGGVSAYKQGGRDICYICFDLKNASKDSLSYTISGCFIEYSL